MQHDVERHRRIGEVNGPQDFLGIVHVDVGEDREAEDAHRLLAVYEQNDPRVSLTLELSDQPLTRRLEKSLFQHRLNRREEKEEPEDVAGRHEYFSHCR